MDFSINLSLLPNLNTHLRLDTFVLVSSHEMLDPFCLPMPAPLMILEAVEDLLTL